MLIPSSNIQKDKMNKHLHSSYSTYCKPKLEDDLEYLARNFPEMKLAKIMYPGDSFGEISLISSSRRYFLMVLFFFFSEIYISKRKEKNENNEYL